MLKRLLSELRHRRVLRTAALYALAAAAAVEFTDIISPVLDLPEGLLRGVITLALVGFPIVMVLSWFFDLSSGGAVRGTSSTEPVSGGRSHVISIMLIGLLATAVAYLSYRLYWENQGQPSFDRGKSIAVLPFSSISANAESDTEYFSKGVAEEIRSALSKVEGLRVAGSTSSIAFRDNDARDVGEALNVSAVLQGTVRRAGNQLRISTQLVDTGTGFQLWSDEYDHELVDVFIIQEEIAHAIVKALRIELLGDSGTRLITPGTESTQAYDKYLEGRNVLQTRTPSAAEQAITIFEEALEFDPNYAQAYAGLADSWILLRDVGDLSLLEATQRSHDAISKALQLNNDLPEAQASLGLCVLGGGQNEGAARLFLKAIELDPDYAAGYLLRANLLRDQGYLSDATRVYTQALALDPLNPAILENQALLFAYQGRFDAALDQLFTLEQREPSRLTVNLTASKVWALAGNNEKALDFARRAAELEPNSPVALAGLVDSYVRIGNPEQAQIELARMRELAPNNETAINAIMRFYLLTGDYVALDQLATARTEGIVDNQSLEGTELLFERVTWVAVARLALGDAQGAREILEKSIPQPSALDPRPSTVHALALLARGRWLDDDPEGAAEIVTVAGQLAERALAQGWGGNQLDYARACVAASTDLDAQALDYLRDAIEAGWDDFVFANHDPVLMDIVQQPEYRALSD